MTRVEVVGVDGLPEVAPGDHLGALVADALRPHAPRDGDVVVVTQKVVSKAEGRLVRSDDRPRVVEEETRRVVARRGDLVIAETRHGFVCANAGVDASNVADGWLSLLPEDPDASAERLRAWIGERLGVDVGVVVTDTFGRPWREGLVNVAIGCAGLPATVDLRGTPDDRGRMLDATVVALADEIAAASGLVMGKASRVPVALVRGVVPPPTVAASSGVSLIRSPDDDLFRESTLVAVAASGEADGFGEGDVARDTLVEALEAAAIGALRVVAAVSPAARGRVQASIEDDAVRETLASAAALLVPIFAGDRVSPRDEALVDAGRSIARLGLALRGLGCASVWVPAAAGGHTLLGAIGSPVGTALGVLAVGRMRTGAASPRPPSDLSALLRFD